MDMLDDSGTPLHENLYSQPHNCLAALEKRDHVKRQTRAFNKVPHDACGLSFDDVFQEMNRVVPKKQKHKIPEEQRLMEEIKKLTNLESIIIEDYVLKGSDYINDKKLQCHFITGQCKEVAFGVQIYSTPDNWNNAPFSEMHSFKVFLENDEMVYLKPMCDKVEEINDLCMFFRNLPLINEKSASIQSFLKDYEQSHLDNVTCISPYSCSVKGIGNKRLTYTVVINLTLNKVYDMEHEIWLHPADVTDSDQAMKQLMEAFNKKLKILIPLVGIVPALREALDILMTI